MRTRRAGVRIVIAALLVPAIARLDVAGAAFVATSANDGNGLTALSVLAQSDTIADLSINVVPLATCQADVHWTASTTTGVDTYEVKRVRVSDGTTAAGPWLVTGTSTTDDPVPLQLLGSHYEWHIRATLGTWRSDWVVATANNLAACLL